MVQYQVSLSVIQHFVLKAPIASKANLQNTEIFSNNERKYDARCFP